MEGYDLDKLLSAYADYYFKHEISIKEFQFHFDNLEKISKPDYIVVLDLKKQDR